MTIRVLLADDSRVVRSLIGRALAPCADIHVVREAADGHEAVQAALLYRPDVVLLDIEMPNMDGMTALPLLLEGIPGLHIIMISRLTQHNAKTTLEALQKGAAACLPKPNNEQELPHFVATLIAQIRALGEGLPLPAPTPPPPRVAPPPPKPAPLVRPTPLPVVPSPAPRRATYHPPLASRHATIRALAIAASTGGPQALTSIFTALRGCSLRVPVFITQHMPPLFTRHLAGSLSQVSGMRCVEGEDGQRAEAGVVYIAPGDYHMRIHREEKRATIRLDQGPPVQSCRPSANIMFASLSEAYGADILAFVLTGMGQDGHDGARRIAANGGMVAAQDAASCTVYGMPRHVIESGIATKILPLDAIPAYIRQEVGRA